MKKISRQPINTDAIQYLQNKQDRINTGEKDHKWWNLTDNKKSIITEKLFKSQGFLCCYCECRIDDKNKHIEHFEERHDCPEKVYDYNNMLLSCEGDRNEDLSEDFDSVERKENTTCGHKKSMSYHINEEIDYSLLLNPTDTRTCYLFSYLNGFVEPSGICNESENLKVEYTIKRLSLDSDKLNRRRDLRFQKILRDIKDIDSTDKSESMKKEEKKRLINSLLDMTKEQVIPYYSMIKGNFEHITR